MRTNSERIEEMHRRASAFKKQQRERRVRIVQTVSAAASFAAVILLALFIPKGETFYEGASGGAQPGMGASIFSGSGSLGYIVIAVIAFVLGVSVTIFCTYLKKWKNEKDKEDDR